uniref:Uncharacterized protein n=1 Tax=Glossina pallidipes TaxID=7398 RepID=A0A1A9ZCL4_GLOPL
MLENVKRKMRRLDKKKSIGRINFCAYLTIMTNQLIGDGKIRIVITAEEDFIGFDVTDVVNRDVISAIVQLLEKTDDSKIVEELEGGPGTTTTTPSADLESLSVTVGLFRDA